MDRKEGGDAERRCEPAPYHMADVGNSLARNAKLVVQTVRARCSPDDHLFLLMAAEDYCRIFPAVHEEYEAELLALVRGGWKTISISSSAFRSS